MASLALSEVATGICKASASADQFAGGLGGAHAAAGDEDRPLGFLQQSERGLHLRGFGLRTERRYLTELRLDQRLHLGFLGVHLTFVAAELQVHRARRAGRGDAERLAQHVGHARDVVDGGIELGHRLERRHVVDFLVDLAELGLGIAAAGDGDDRRMREVGVAQARGQIERADHLRHADARLAGGARITVRHVGGRLFAVAVNARDRRAALHLGESPPQHRRHHEHVGDAVAFEHVGDHFGAETFGIVAKRHDFFNP